eukprot:TRINITY_DN60994_c0_g1_i3.p4 TRINITY_DN60994_c0_g1~~TRINITY_DN60994_c0_g1_i3.p4  ORF type:complete len:139 (-),score=1.52 TRINITY_DN60994_c0_g1_i3:182-598(-)
MMLTLRLLRESIDVVLTVGFENESEQQVNDEMFETNRQNYINALSQQPQRQHHVSNRSNVQRIPKCHLRILRQASRPIRRRFFHLPKILYHRSVASASVSSLSFWYRHLYRNGEASPKPSSASFFSFLESPASQPVAV